MRDPLSTLLFLFGVGFLGANLSVLYDSVQSWRRRRLAILVWPPARPRVAALPVVISVGLGGLIVWKLVVLQWPVDRLFGEAMMLTYYGYLYPLSLRICRGFYEDGIRLDRGFTPWPAITALTWHQDPLPALVVVAEHQQRAGRLTVPPEHFGEARRILRDRIAAHELVFDKPLLDLGGHDRRDDA
ncbi:MAG: hypothetical protein NTY02_19030 [Acidobacteria bacterium]|nr:hypothetical protein [Acidobacteriota bacterium]